MANMHLQRVGTEVCEGYIRCGHHVKGYERIIFSKL